MSRHIRFAGGGAQLMVVRIGVWLSLFPLAMVDSLIASLMSAVLFALSLVLRPRLTFFDGVLLVLLLLGIYALGTVGSFGRAFIDSQISAYLVFICSLRFFHAAREPLRELLLAWSAWSFALLCGLYLLVQVQVGYVYELGVLEVLLLVRIAISKRARYTLLALLLGYLLAMFAISTRSTPLLVAMVVVAVAVLPLPAGVWRAAYLVPVLATPFIGFFLLYQPLSAELAVLDDNAEIRVEMLRGASSMIGLHEFFLGTGFGQPFRAASFDYSFWHPLLKELFWTYQVSNHNSMFDVFLRFGIFGYALFCVVFLKALALGRVRSRYVWALLFILLYSLSVNAYLDSTRLAHTCAALVGALYLLLRPMVDPGTAAHNAAAVPERDQAGPRLSLPTPRRSLHG